MFNQMALDDKRPRDLRPAHSISIFIKQCFEAIPPFKGKYFCKYCSLKSKKSFYPEFEIGLCFKEDGTET